MLPYTFEYSNPFSAIELRDASVRDAVDQWSPEDFDRRYLLGPGLAAFGTSQDIDYTVTVEEADSETVPADCYRGILVPVKLTAGQVHIRGGYSDVDINTPAAYVAVAFFELLNGRILIRLSTRPFSRTGEVHGPAVQT